MNYWLSLVSQLLGLASLLQTIELIKLKEAWVDEGVWSWQLLREDEESFPRKLLPVFDFLLSERNFEIVLYLRAVFSLFLILGSEYLTPTLLVFLGTWLCSIRWRGTFNGGSDSMTAQTALALVISRLSVSATLEHLALTIIAVQVTASYFVAGISKARNPQWTSGAALPEFFKLPSYDRPPAWLRNFLAKPGVAKKASIALISFECLFPLSWLHPTLALYFIAAAIAFHLICYVAFGLNRFVFAWLATYPALYWMAWKLDQ